MCVRLQKIVNFIVANTRPKVKEADERQNKPQDQRPSHSHSVRFCAGLWHSVFVYRFSFCVLSTHGCLAMSPYITCMVYAAVAVFKAALLDNTQSTCQTEFSSIR